MYCPTCGNQLAQALSYCNRCGANLKPGHEQGETMPPGKAINSLMMAIVAAAIILLGMGLGALVLMKQGAIPEGLGTAFVIICFLTLPVIEGLLVWQVMRLNKAAKGEGGIAQAKDSGAALLNAATTRALPDAVEPVPSVTEQTTRAFEPLYRDGERR